jgi:hypothetical protein
LSLSLNKYCPLCIALLLIVLTLLLLTACRCSTWGWMSLCSGILFDAVSPIIRIKSRTLVGLWSWLCRFCMILIWVANKWFTCRILPVSFSSNRSLWSLQYVATDPPAWLLTRIVCLPLILTEFGSWKKGFAGLLSILRIPLN